MSTLTPATPIQYLKGVGPYLAQLFQKKSIYTASDMLFYLPVKYVDRRQVHSIKSLPMDKKQTFFAVVQKISSHFIPRNRRKILEIHVSDDSGVAALTFFQFNENYLKKKFPIGSKVMVFGDVRSYRGFKNVVHPEIELWEEDDLQPGIHPFYSLTEGLYQKIIRTIFKRNLDDLLSILEDDPHSVRDSGEVQISLKTAFQYVHEPPLDSNIEDLNAQKSAYHQRIIYDEFFYLQLGLLSKNLKIEKNKSCVIVNEKKLYNAAIKDLPFELTGDQQKVLEHIKNDFATGTPMNRMLQGDVGSGKTIVAFLSALLAVESGFQVAFMVPTEVLAEQHFKKLFPYEEKLGVHMELLLGSTKNKKREQILYDLEQGICKLVIGTHALITPDVKFHQLGFVIIDEQHRFGVVQRAQLKNKSKLVDSESSPHLLVMTATPIPRTLSMCVYGDLDLSIIREMPKGRKPIQTKVFREKQRQKMYEMIHRELQKGRQAYFVYPLVEESEKVDLKDATLMHENLSREFSDYKVGLLHGRMKSEEKESVMDLYKTNQVHVLVSTTVIEVGVDVLNATVMVIEHAERFGLSQLHQLRGRVGRGSEDSWCFLVASYAQSEESRFRLKIMEDTTDGFIIAEEDLKIRGPGEFLGTKQSGLPDFHLAQLVRDEHLLRAAKKRAEEILFEDPQLFLEKNHRMKKIMLERWEKKLDLTLV